MRELEFWKGTKVAAREGGEFVKQEKADLLQAIVSSFNLLPEATFTKAPLFFFFSFSFLFFFLNWGVIDL